MKKLICVWLAAVMMFCFSTSVFAADTAESITNSHIEARYNAFDTVWVYLTETQPGILHVEGGAGTSSSSNYVEIRVVICQYKNPQQGMVPVDGFEWTSASQFGTSLQANRSVSRGSYQAIIYAKCYQNGVLVDDVEVESSIVNVVS